MGFTLSVLHVPVLHLEAVAALPPPFAQRCAVWPCPSYSACVVPLRVYPEAVLGALAGDCVLYSPHAGLTVFGGSYLLQLQNAEKGSKQGPFCIKHYAAATG